MCVPNCNICNTPARHSGVGTGYGYLGYQWWYCDLCQKSFTEGIMRHGAEEDESAIECHVCKTQQDFVDIGNQKFCFFCYPELSMSATCPKCKRVSYGVSTSPIHFVPGSFCSCGHEFQIEQPQQMMTCGCCGGSGYYDPLQGPREPCGTCKGEKVVPVGGPFSKEQVGNMVGFRIPGAGPFRTLSVDVGDGDESSFLRQSLGVAYVPDPSRPLNGEKAVLDVIDEIGGVPLSQIKFRSGTSFVQRYIDSAPNAEERRKRKSETFGVLYGGPGPTSIREALTQTERDRIDALGSAQTFGEIYGEFLQRRDAIENEALQGHAGNFQSESRIHRKGKQSADISIKISIPPELHESIGKVQGMMAAMIKQMKAIGITAEAASTRVGSFVRELDLSDIDDEDFDADAAIESGSVKRPESWADLRERTLRDYVKADAEQTIAISKMAGGLFPHQTAIVEDALKMGKTMRFIDFHDNADFANVELAIAEKRAAVQTTVMERHRRMELNQMRAAIDLNRAMMETKPLYYDPETGTVSP